MLTKALNIGEHHGHLRRVLDSKLTYSENCAPMYYMHKDHKETGGWRPVVSRCNSITLGLSNLLSACIDSTASFKDNWQLIGSDMVALFPSLSAEKTAESVRKQAEKIKIVWENIDDRLIRLYIHLN